MIIDKVQQFMTDAEREELEEAFKEADRISEDTEQRIKEKSKETGPPPDIDEDGQLTITFNEGDDEPDDWNEFFKALEKTDDINTRIEQRYIKSFKNNPAGLIEDAEEIANALTREDFLVWRDRRLKFIEFTGDDIFKTATTFVKMQIRVQITGLAIYELDYSKIEQGLIKKTVRRLTTEATDEDGAEAIQIALTGFNMPTTNTMTVDKITNNLALLNKTINEIEAKVNGDDEPFMQVIAQFDFLDEDTRRRIDKKDEGILQTVISFMLSGITVFTAAQVYRAYNHNKTRPSPEQLADFVNRLDKMLRIVTKIDATDLINRKSIKVKNEAELRLESYFLPLKKLYYKDRDGNEVIYYQLLDAPILYNFAKLSAKEDGSGGQILTYPARLLDVPDFKRDTDERTILKKEIIKHIELLKNKSNSYTQTTITIERLLNAVTSATSTDDGEETLSSKKWENFKTNLKTILDHYKKINYIKSYEIKSVRKKPVSVKIIPNSNYKMD